MRGLIYVFNAALESGIIITAAGQRLLFRTHDWQSSEPPTRGMNVEFLLYDNAQARHVTLVQPDA